MPDSPPSNRIESSREQVVEAMAYALVDRNADIADRNPAPTVWEEAADDSKAMLQAALSTGLLKLVEERPEEPRESFINETAKVANRNYGTGGNPEAALYSAGHHPEGEPSTIRFLQALNCESCGRWLDLRCSVDGDLGEETAKRAIGRALAAIDHPQDR